MVKEKKDWCVIIVDIGKRSKIWDGTYTSGLRYLPAPVGQLGHLRKISSGFFLAVESRNLTEEKAKSEADYLNHISNVQFLAKK